jgi:hypothetical protein
MANPAHAANPALRVKLPYDSSQRLCSRRTGCTVLERARCAPLHCQCAPSAISCGSRNQSLASSTMRRAERGARFYLAMESFKSTTGIDVVHVPYKAQAPALTDVIGGQVPMMFTTTPASLAHIKSGRLRALGASSGKRLPLLRTCLRSPKAGIRVSSSMTGTCVLAPAATPRTIIDRLNAAINKALTAAGRQRADFRLGAEPAFEHTGPIRRAADTRSGSLGESDQDAGCES